MMDIEINTAFIEQLKISKGQSSITLKQLEEISLLLTDNSAKAIKLGDGCFLKFIELANIEFCITDFKREKDLAFLGPHLMYTDASQQEVTYLKFLFNEFLQGQKFERVQRLIVSISPIIVVNLIVYFFATFESMRDVFVGLLSAMSFFIAVFALFIVDSDHFGRKKLLLFEKGKLAYYFSIDKHLIRTATYAILFSLAGIISCSHAQRVDEHGEVQVALIVILFNLAFIGAIIVLRSIREFYMNRPSAFLMPELKEASFQQYIKKSNK
jgi:hypothetical protein